MMRYTGIMEQCNSIMPGLGFRCDLDVHDPTEEHVSARPEGSIYNWNYGVEDAPKTFAAFTANSNTTITNSERRVVDPETGAAKGVKIERPDLIPVGALRELAVHYGRGEEKYPSIDGHPNWRLGYSWSSSYAALQRHAQAFWDGENIDEETGSKHLIAAAWHCLALATFMDEQPEKDDRVSTIRKRMEQSQSPPPKGEGL